MPESRLSAQLYTIPEVAERLKITPLTVWKQIHRGEVRAVKISRMWRISGEELKRILSHGTRKPK